MIEEALAGGRSTAGVVRIGDTVHRPFRGDRSFQHDCLCQLAALGFDGVPRLMGIDPEGREILSFMPGHVPDELGFYSDEQLRAAARLMRAFHNATSLLPAVRKAGAAVACHNDWAPTNAVFRDGMPVAMIDFDTLAPGPRLWDLGYAAFTWLDLGNDDHAGEEQLRRLSLFAAAYGADECTPAPLAVFVLARQAALAASARARGLDPIADWASAAAAWTALNVVEPLVPSGYSPPGTLPSCAS